MRVGRCHPMTWFLYEQAGSWHARLQPVYEVGIWPQVNLLPLLSLLTGQGRVAFQENAQGRNSHHLSA